MATGANGHKTLDDRLTEAVNNSVRHAKRSLLDFVDLWYDPLPPDLKRAAWPLVGVLKRRIHNDVSNIRDQVNAAFEIYKSGGIIPVFGRSEEEMRATAAVATEAGKK